MKRISMILFTSAMLAIAFAGAAPAQVERGAGLTTRVSRMSRISAGRADVVPGVDPKLENRSVRLWFNPAAFRIPTAFNWGNLGRNTLTGPPAYNFDLTVVKKFPVAENKHIIFRAEFFNAFNTPQFTLPASTIGATGVGTIAATARPSRQIQFALKFVF